MQSVPTTALTSVPSGSAVAKPAALAAGSNAYNGYQIIRRNGAVVAFEPTKIAVAMTKAFLAVRRRPGRRVGRIRETVEQLTDRRGARADAPRPEAAPSTSRTSRTRSNWR